MSFRTLIETPEFAAEKQMVEPDAKRLDEMLWIITWALSREPEHYPLVPGTKSLHMVMTDPFPDAPEIRIWYSYDDTRVFLHSIELVEGQE